MRSKALAFGIVLAGALAFGAPSARAQVGLGWPTYGVYGMGGYGWGLGFPGAAGVGMGVPWGYGGFGMPWGGVGGMGWGGGFGVGGMGWGGMGWGGMGWGAPVGFGYPGFGWGGMGYGYGAPGPLGYPPIWDNPASLSLGITPLALQSALMERGLGTLPMRAAPVGMEQGGFGVGQAGFGDGGGGGQPLPAGIYRIEPIRLDAQPAGQQFPRQ